MDLENQKRVKEFAEQYGPENVVVLLGAAEGEASGLAAETVTAGDPTYAGPLTGVSLGLTVYHVCEPEVKAEFDPAVYDEQISMMEMVLDVDDIINEMSSHPRSVLQVSRQISKLHNQTGVYEGGGFCRRLLQFGRFQWLQQPEAAV